MGNPNADMRRIIGYELIPLQPIGHTAAPFAHKTCGERKRL